MIWEIPARQVSFYLPLMHAIRFRRPVERHDLQTFPVVGETHHQIRPGLRVVKNKALLANYVSFDFCSFQSDHHLTSRGAQRFPQYPFRLFRGAPRLFRPELRQIGFLSDGYRILK